MAFARSTTSSSEFEGRHGGDGSERLLAHDERIVGHVDEQRGRHEQRPRRRRLPDQSPRTAPQRIVDPRLCPGNGALVHQRADLDALLEAVANLQRRDPLSEGGAEVAIKSALHINAIGGQAILARSREFGGHGDLDRAIELGVVEYHQRSVSTEFHDQTFYARRALAGDQAADFG